MKRVGLSLIMAVLLAACGGGEAPPPQESIASTADVTEAIGVEPITAAPSLTEPPTPNVTRTPIIRPTLPPTWTPTTPPTDAPTRTPIGLSEPLPTSMIGSELAICLTFGPDFARTPSSATVGDSVTVYWTPAGGQVFYYELELRDAGGALLEMRRMTPSTRSYRFDDSFFTFNGVYTWSVTPYDSSAEPLCPARTSELRATVQ